MLYRIQEEIAGGERPWIVGDSEWDRIGCLHMFRAVGSWAIAVVDVRFEGGKRIHIFRIHQGLEVGHPKLTPRKKDSADSH